MKTVTGQRTIFNLMDSVKTYVLSLALIAIPCALPAQATQAEHKDLRSDNLSLGSRNDTVSISGQQIKQSEIVPPSWASGKKPAPHSRNRGTQTHAPQKQAPPVSEQHQNRSS